MAEIECPDCDQEVGNIFGHRGNGRCKRCHGMGETYNAVDKVIDFATMGKAESITPCNICSETGQCQTCGGTGYIHTHAVDYKEEQSPNRERKNEFVKHNQSKYQPGNGSTVSKQIQIIIGLIVIAVIVAVVWFIFKVVLPLIIINIATIALIGSFFKKDRQKVLRITSFLGAILIILDYNNGWSTQSLIQNASFSYGIIKFYLYLNITAGIVAVYFVIRDFLNGIYGVPEIGNEFTKRNIIIMACLLVFGGTTIFLQNYFRARSTFNYNNTNQIKNDQMPSQVNNDVSNIPSINKNNELGNNSPENDGKTAGLAFFHCKEELRENLIKADEMYTETFYSKNFKTVDEATNWKNVMEISAYKINKVWEDIAHNNQVQIVSKYNDQELKRFYMVYNDIINGRSDYQNRLDSFTSVINNMISSLPKSPLTNDPSASPSPPINNTTPSQSNNLSTAIVTTQKEEEPQKAIKKECEVNNTGDWCFSNSTSKAAYVLVVQGYQGLSVNAGQTQCFYALKAGVYKYKVWKPSVRAPDYMNLKDYDRYGYTPDATGQFKVEQCQSTTFSIR